MPDVGIHFTDFFIINFSFSRSVKIDVEHKILNFIYGFLPDLPTDSRSRIERMQPFENLSNVVVAIARRCWFFKLWRIIIFFFVFSKNAIYARKLVWMSGEFHSRFNSIDLFVFWVRIPAPNVHRDKVFMVVLHSIATFVYFCVCFFNRRSTKCHTIIDRMHFVRWPDIDEMSPDKIIKFCDFLFFSFLSLRHNEISRSTKIKFK